MQIEEVIVKELTVKFPYLAGKAAVNRARRITLFVEQDKFADLFEYAVSAMDFHILCTITGFDDGLTIGLIYHLAREDGVMLNVKTCIPRDNPIVKTVTRTFHGAEIYERELVDLLGVTVEGLLEGKRYPLPDDWPDGQYPLRKDWKQSVLATARDRKVDHA